MTHIWNSTISMWSVWPMYGVCIRKYTVRATQCRASAHNMLSYDWILRRILRACSPSERNARLMYHAGDNWNGKCLYMRLFRLNRNFSGYAGWTSQWSGLIIYWTLFQTTIVELTSMSFFWFQWNLTIWRMIIRHWVQVREIFFHRHMGLQVFLPCCLLHSA